MSPLTKPTQKPSRPYFSSGPCSKRPGWAPEVLKDALVGRSHRSREGKARLKLAIDMTRRVLGVPEDYKIAIVPGSDTGAFEMAMWNMLGARGVDVFAWEVFGRVWLKDAIDELRLPDLRTFDCDWGELPDLSKADFSRDVVFTWNGTTTGVRLPNADWIPDDRAGLTFADATSGVFAQPIDFKKIDVLTYSWQKALGGEAAHGILIVSPRALERLASYRPTWPMPKVFRLTNNKGPITDVYDGVTINTPSMLCVEDYIDALTWIESIGGVAETIRRADQNAKIIYDWAARTPWVEPLAKDPATYSNTSLCLKFTDPAVVAKGEEAATKFCKAMGDLLDKEGAAYDIGSYRGIPAGFRVWTGTTVEAKDIGILLTWLEWAYGEVKAKQA